MIIIPLSTDAPIYHWPWMTLVLILGNVVVFVTTGYGAETSGWFLQYGHGWHPFEWIASNFVHFGWLQLIGNMVFLWAFGMIVEGKVGWWRFLLLYLLLGGLGRFIEQTMMLSYDGGSLIRSGSASLCVYGLLAICAVWAPKNEVNCWMLFFYRGIEFEISLLTLGVWYIGVELLASSWTGFRIGSSLLHLMGAVLGFGIGVAMLKWRWVDCENWDLFAVWSGKYGQAAESSDWQENILVTHAPSQSGDDPAVPAKLRKAKTRLRRSSNRPDQSPRRRSSGNVPATDADDKSLNAPRRTMSESALPPATLKALDRLRELLQAGKPQAAVSEYRKRLRIVDHWPLDAEDLQALADGLFQHKVWDEAILLLEEFVRRFPERADAARIKLAAMCCEVQTRPRAALKLLEQLELEELPESIRLHVDQIRQKAERMIEDGTLELHGQGW